MHALVLVRGVLSRLVRVLVQYTRTLLVDFFFLRTSNRYCVDGVGVAVCVTAISATAVPTGKDVDAAFATSTVGNAVGECLAR